MKKRYKIVSPVRFVTFITVMVLLVAALVIHMFGLDNVSGASKTYYRQIEVCAGDTLWEIADDYMPDDMDPRDAVYQIAKINEIEDGIIHPGQILLVPTDDPKEAEKVKL